MKFLVISVLFLINSLQAYDPFQGVQQYPLTRQYQEYPQYYEDPAYYEQPPVFFDPQWRGTSVSQDFGIDPRTGEPRFTKSPIQQMIDYMRMLHQVDSYSRRPY